MTSPPRATDSLVLTFVGPDRPGLVNLIAEAVARHGGNWLESRLANLAGAFAGVVLVQVSAPARAGLITSLAQLEQEGLRITIASGQETAAPAGTPLRLELVAHDRPGIVRDVTQTLTRLGVNIEDFSSALESAPFTGETLFKAQLSLSLPADVPEPTVRGALERLAHELMVDIKTPEPV
jgi:glycine cleavage system regulatory protein